MEEPSTSERFERLGFAHALWIAVALALVNLGLESTRGVLAAHREVASHGYAEMGFERSAFLTYERATSAALRSAIQPSLWLAGLAFTALLVLARRTGFGRHPATIQRSLARRSTVGWSAFLLAVCGTAALVRLHDERSWVGARDCAWVILFALGGASVLALLARTARRSATPQAQARLTAMLLGWLVVLAPALLIGQRLIYHPTDARAWTEVAGALVLATAVAAWTLPRAKRVLADRAPTLWSSALGACALASLVVLVLVSALPVCESSLGAPTLAADKPRNVLIIAIDTLRYDATSVLGPNARGHDTTPNLRRLAQRGVWFDQAISQAPWTVPAFGSLLTGRYPNEHGAYRIAGGLRNSETTLAEILREAGYATLGAVSQFYLRAGSGFDQGCDRYYASPVGGELAVTSKHVTDAVIRQLDAHGERPFFAFAHYYDPHSEYIDHAEWPWADGYNGWLREQNRYENLLRSRHLLEAADLRFVEDCYDEEIAFTDREIGRLLDWLDHGDAWRDTLVVLVVDHGDEFLDHGNFGHTITLYDELVRVPLIIVPPGSSEGSRYAGVVETRRVLATVLDELDLEFASGEREHSLLRTARASPPATSAKAFAITRPDDALPAWGLRYYLSGLRNERWKAVHDWTRERRFLFDLTRDPGELHDVSAEFPDVARELGEELDRWTHAQLSRDTGATSVVLDSDEVRALRGLGYMGGGQ